MLYGITMMSVFVALAPRCNSTLEIIEARSRFRFINAWMSALETHFDRDGIDGVRETQPQRAVGEVIL